MFQPRVKTVFDLECGTINEFIIYSTTSRFRPSPKQLIDTAPWEPIEAQHQQGLILRTAMRMYDRKITSENRQ